MRCLNLRLHPKKLSFKPAESKFKYQATKYDHGPAAHQQERGQQISPRDISKSTNTTIEANYLAEVITPNEIGKVDYIYDRTDAIFESYYMGGPPINGQYTYTMCQLSPRMNSIKIYAYDKVTLNRQIMFQTDYFLRPGTFDATSDLYVWYDTVVDSHTEIRKVNTIYYLSNIVNAYGNPVVQNTTDNPIRQNLTAASLTLRSVIITDGNGNKLPPYIFEYDPNTNAALRVVTKRCAHGSTEPSDWPVYTVEERDLWGYYNPNGANAGDNDFNPEGSSVKALRADYTPWADAWSLRKITMPAGQRLSWEYEANQYDMANNHPLSNLQYGGGIRVKKVTSFTGLGQQSTLSYFYNDMDGLFNQSTTNSSGHATVLPYNYISETELRDAVTRGGLYTPCKVAYEKVQVVQNLNTANLSAPNGFTSYNFVTSKEFPNLGGYGDFDRSNLRGMVKSMLFYNSGKKCISEQKNEFVNQISGNRQNGLVMEYGMGTNRQTKKTETLLGVAKRIEYKYAPDIGMVGDIARTASLNSTLILVPTNIPQI
jgi:hypothetical protein